MLTMNSVVLAYAPLVIAGALVIIVLLVGLNIFNASKKNKRWARDEAFADVVENKKALERMAKRIKILMERGELETPELVEKFIQEWDLNSKKE